jgi:hypothetical protein
MQPEEDNATRLAQLTALRGPSVRAVGVDDGAEPRRGFGARLERRRPR